MDPEINQTLEIKVLTYINPHFFWFLKVEEQRERSKFTKILNESCASVVRECDKPQLGKNYVIKYDNNWMRACLKYKRCNDSTITYLCWLIDYGIFVYAEEIYKLPLDIPKLPGYAQRGMLFGLQCLSNKIDENGFIQKVVSDTWNFGSSKKIRQILETENSSIVFIVELIYNNIFVGSVCVQPESNESFVLSKKLIETGIAVYNETAFKQDLFADKFTTLSPEKVMANLNIYSQNKASQDLDDFEMAKSAGCASYRHNRSQASTSNRSVDSTQSRSIKDKNKSHFYQRTKKSQNSQIEIKENILENCKQSQSIQSFDGNKISSVNKKSFPLPSNVRETKDLDRQGNMTTDQKNKFIEKHQSPQNQRRTHFASTNAKQVNPQNNDSPKNQKSKFACPSNIPENAQKNIKLLNKFKSEQINRSSNEHYSNRSVQSNMSEKSSSQGCDRSGETPNIHRNDQFEHSSSENDYRSETSLNDEDLNSSSNTTDNSNEFIIKDEHGFCVTVRPLENIQNRQSNKSETSSDSDDYFDSCGDFENKEMALTARKYIKTGKKLFKSLLNLDSDGDSFKECSNNKIDMEMPEKCQMQNKYKDLNKGLRACQYAAKYTMNKTLTCSNIEFSSHINDDDDDDYDDYYEYDDDDVYTDNIMSKKDIDEAIPSDIISQPKNIPNKHFSHPENKDLQNSQQKGNSNAGKISSHQKNTTPERNPDNSENKIAESVPKRRLASLTENFKDDISSPPKNIISNQTSSQPNLSAQTKQCADKNSEKRISKIVHNKQRKQHVANFNDKISSQPKNVKSKQMSSQSNFTAQTKQYSNNAKNKGSTKIKKGSSSSTNNFDSDNSSQSKNMPQQSFSALTKQFTDKVPAAKIINCVVKKCSTEEHTGRDNSAMSETSSSRSKSDYGRGKNSQRSVSKILTSSDENVDIDNLNPEMSPNSKNSTSTKSIDSDLSSFTSCISNFSNKSKFKHSINKYSSTNSSINDNVSEKKVEHDMQNGKCECDTCEGWRDNSNVFKECTPEVRTKPVMNIIKPSLLFKTDEKESYVIQKNIKTYKNMIDKLTAPRLLVHGHFIPKYVDNIRFLPYHNEVRKALWKLGYQKTHIIQSYSSPAVMRGHHVFIVNGSNSGKSMVYVPALCSFIKTAPENTGAPTGPIAVVICPGVESADKVFSLMTNVMQFSTNKPKISYVVPPLLTAQKLHNVDSSNIIICTPKSLISLLTEKKVRLKRLCHVVLEDCDVLYEKYATQMEYIMMSFQNTLMKRTYRTSIQLIVVSKHWSHALEMLAKRLIISPFICIGAHLEGALYGRADIKVKFINSNLKPTYVFGLTDKESLYHKTVVVCNNRYEIRKAIEQLNYNGLPHIMLDNTSNIEDVNEVQRRWLAVIPGRYFVLVCSDDVLSTSLNITDASCVIQYSLPESWSRFVLRFSLFLDNYSSPLRENQDDIQCIMHIFVDENNTKQFPKIFNFLKRMNCTLPETIIEKYNEIIKTNESTKLSNRVEICDNINQFGACQNISCLKRHVISKDLDISSTIPQSGIIKLKLLHVYNVTRFSARLIEYTDSNNVIHKLSDSYSIIAARITSILTNRKTLLEVEVGMLCAVEEKTDLFRRCRISKILMFGSYKIPIKVQVMLLDTGDTKDVNVSELYVLPEELHKIPPQVVEVYIADTGPPENDTEWIPFCRGKLLNDLKNANFDDHNSYFTGRIKLQLGNAIWVNNLILHEQLENDSTLVYKMSVRSHLMKYHLAEENSKQMKHLYKLCEDSGFILPDYSLPVIRTTTVIPKQQEPMWAHLENLEDYNAVYFCSADSTDHFYIRLSNIQSSFDRLQDDIQSAISKPLYPKKFDVFEGRCYLAKDPQGNSYSRVLVTKLEDDIANCFFVDYGDRIKIPACELKFLIDDLIGRLPFQVIECKLYGIKPNGDDWCCESYDYLYELAFEPDSDILRQLYVKVIEHEPSVMTGNKKYSIVLVDTFIDDIIINNLLIKKGFALNCTDEDIVIDFEQLKMNKKQEIEEEEEEDDIYEREYTPNEIKEMSKKFMKEEPSEAENIEEIVRPETPDSSNLSYDIQIHNIDAMMAELNKVNEYKSFIGSSNHVKKNESPIDDHISNYSLPQVVWSQTKNEIKLQVQLIGVKTYELNIFQNIFVHFHTKHNDINYRLNIELHAKVAEKYFHEARGMYIVIKLTKHICEEWPKLTETYERQRYITYEVSGDNDSDKGEVPKIKDANCDENESYTFEVGSDIDYDESDIESSRSSD